jgi:hypothetical protein
MGGEAQEGRFHSWLRLRGLIFARRESIQLGRIWSAPPMRAASLLFPAQLPLFSRSFSFSRQQGSQCPVWAQADGVDGAPTASSVPGWSLS